MSDYLGPYLLGPNDTPENGIYTGDARELAQAIPDESVDLIFTDPVYQNIDDYYWLAETAARVLKPVSSCLVFCGNAYKFDAMKALADGGLAYRWDFATFLVGLGATYWHGKVGVKWTSCLWYEKEHFIPYRSFLDAGALPRGMINSYEWIPTGHRWHKSSRMFQRLNAFCKPDGLVLDPFTGGGTVPAVCKMLSRRYLAFEIEPEIAELARKRVRMTQPPLFTLQPQQGNLRLLDADNSTVRIADDK